MINLDNIGIKGKTRLQIDTVNALLLRNHSMSDIARIHGIKPPSVSRFMAKYKDQLAIGVAKYDDLSIAKAMRIVGNGLEVINNIITSTEFNKKDLATLSITIGTIFDKLRLMRGESTQNVAIDVVRRSAEEKLARIRELEAEDVKVS